MRLALILGAVGGLSLAACTRHVSQGVPSMDVARHIISLERSALDRWIHADPDGYLGLYANPTGSADERVLARWNATEVYRRQDGTWRIIHTHWSFTQPQLAGAAPK